MACKHDTAASHLVKASQIVHQDLFMTSHSFNGSLKNGNETAVPKPLLALISMILDGATIKEQTEKSQAGTKAAVSISELVVFNSVKTPHRRDFKSNVRHSTDRETPLPIFVALKIHALIRSRDLITTFYQLGICISYDHLLQISAQMANGVCDQFHIDQVVCPPKMRKGIFTCLAVDNIDHNPTSATSQDSFHGTGISVMQFPSKEVPGNECNVVLFNKSSAQISVKALPSSYATVPPVSLKKTQFSAPPI